MQRPIFTVRPTFGYAPAMIPNDHARLHVLITALAFALPIVAGCAGPKSIYRSASPVSPWPRTIPCRTSNADSPNVLVTTLGNVRTPLADGTFDPVNDRVTLNDGATIEHYYRDTLKVAHYQPIDKSIFPLPPSGWCSWYYYYQQVTPEEVKRNAEWLARNLLEYGARYCQLDDGWQGTGHGLGENRDWSTIDRRFAAGMDDLAGYIRQCGLEAGLWLAPHGQSNPELVKRTDAFLLDEAGASLSDTWEGKYLIDPTKPNSKPYLQALFRRLCEDGYTYFKIDGQPIVIDEYKKHAEHMAHPPADSEAAYRDTIHWIRETIGERRYLLGCWGMPLAGAGIMNGSRTAGDIIQGPSGLKIAARATMQNNYLHNIVWYCDPDVCLVRPPASVETARAWATLQGLTGQALLASDRLTDLAPERVEILKRIFPAVDIRPLDLFDPGDQLKPILDLKVDHLGRAYDVVGCFNFDPDKPDSVLVRWKDLGLEASALYHVYDFWNREYLGCWESGYFAPVPPAGCVVLTLVRAGNAPQLISTDRHITQGWIDLLEAGYNPRTLTYRGRSQLIGGDPYTLTFGFPRAHRTFAIASADCDGASVSIMNHQGWAAVRLDSPRTRTVSWTVTFAPERVYKFDVDPAPTPAVERVKARDFKLTWGRPYNNEAGFAVYLDDELLGIAPHNVAVLRRVPADGRHKVGLRNVWWDGAMSKEPATVELPEGYPAELYLSDLEPRLATQGWGTLACDRSVSGPPLQIGDTVYKKGLGTHSAADIEYDLGGRYNRFTAAVGVDNHTGKAEAKLTFEVWADDAKLWETGPMTKTDAARPVDLDITGVKSLRLHVGESDDTNDYDHADWAEAKVTCRTPE